MEMKIADLKDLFIEQGRELYEATKLEQKELPSILEQAKNPQLKRVIEKQINLAKDQQNHIKRAFQTFDKNPEGEKNECCQSILKQTKALIGRSKDHDIKDAVIVNSIQRLNHSKITGLGSISSYAKAIDENNISEILHNTLNEEKLIDRELTQLAENEINKKAIKSAVG